MRGEIQRIRPLSNTQPISNTNTSQQGRTNEFWNSQQTFGQKEREDDYFFDGVGGTVEGAGGMRTTMRVSAADLSTMAIAAPDRPREDAGDVDVDDDVVDTVVSGRIASNSRAAAFAAATSCRFDAFTNIHTCSAIVAYRCGIHEENRDERVVRVDDDARAGRRRRGRRRRRRCGR